MHNEPHTLPYTKYRRELEEKEHKLQMIQKNIPFTHELIMFIIGEDLEETPDEQIEEIAEALGERVSQVKELQLTVEDILFTAPKRRSEIPMSIKEPSETSSVSSLEEIWAAERNLKPFHDPEEAQRELDEYLEEVQTELKQEEDRMKEVEADFERLDKVIANDLNIIKREIEECQNLYPQVFKDESNDTILFHNKMWDEPYEEEQEEEEGEEIE